MINRIKNGVFDLMLSILVAKVMSKFSLEEESGATYSLKYNGNPPSTIHDAELISLAKWSKLRKIIAGGFIKKNPGYDISDGGDETCGYCMIFASMRCIGCPIQYATGKVQCKDTPYFDARSRLWTLSMSDTTKELTLKAIDKEISFLKDVIKKTK
jgi:hypothetical protein